MLEKVKNTSEVVNATLDQLDDKLLENDYPVLVFEKITSIGYLLMHLATHLSYHLGQVNYHRRLMDGY